MAYEIDAVVVSYNSADTLRACVEPLAAMPGVRVTVVDNASSDGSLATIADLPEVQAIDSGRNGGFGFGCNVGMRAGDAPLVLFLNPDARIAPADLDALVATLAAEPDAGVVGPRLLDDDGELIPSIRRWQRPASVWAQALFLHRLLPSAAWANEIERSPEAYNEPADAEWLSGAALLGRREALEAIGGFDDERFFLYCEDMDLCARLAAAGWRSRYVPEATVHHIGGHSAPRDTLLGILTQSRIAYARAHGGPLAAAAVRAGLAVEALLRIVASVRRPSRVRGQLVALRSALGPA